MKLKLNIKLSKKIIIAALIIATTILSLFILNTLERRNIREASDMQIEKFTKQGYEVEYGAIKSNLFGNKVTTLDTKMSFEGFNIYIDETIEDKDYLLKYRKNPNYIPEYSEAYLNGIRFDEEIMQAVGLTEENPITVKIVERCQNNECTGNVETEVKHRLKSALSMTFIDAEQLMKAAKILETKKMEELSEEETREYFNAYKIKEFSLSLEDTGIYNYLKVKYFFIFSNSKELVKAIDESKDLSQIQKDTLSDFVESPRKIEFIFKNEKALSFTEIADTFMRGEVDGIEFMLKLNDKDFPVDLAESVSNAAKLVKEAEQRKNNRIQNSQ